MVKLTKRFAKVDDTDEGMTTCITTVYNDKLEYMRTVTKLETKLTVITFSNEVHVCCDDMLKYLWDGGRTSKCPLGSSYLHQWGLNFCI